MGIFSKRIEAAYASTPPAPPLSIVSPWSPNDSLVTFAVDDALGGLLSEHGAIITREVALRIPAVKKAHALHVRQFAQVPMFVYDGATRLPADQQPRWLTTSDSGVSPYHRMYGVGSDLFFYGWAVLGFTSDLSDCLHIPYGLWHLDDDRNIVIDERLVPAAYRAYPVAIPAGYGENGLLNDGIDTLREARAIEAAYMDRLDNPVPLTILGIPQNVWESWTPDERKSYREQWIAGRKSSNGAVAMKVAEWPIDMPGQVAVDLYETGRNAVRLDIANHTSTPAALLEGARQGGGNDITYTGVDGGANRSELWDFGLARGFLLATEARLSMDDVCAPGLSIRGDVSNYVAIPTPATHPTSED